MKGLQLAINTAITAHAGQLDKGGTEYINHPIYLALQMNTIEEKIVALLHDVIEDSDLYPIQDVEPCFGKIIFDAVDCITKRNGEKYEDYLIRVKSNPIALKVKMADIDHNLQLDRIPVVTEKHLKMAEKYREALKFLES